MADVDRSQGNIKRKIRNAELAAWNYILVAGEDEMHDGLVDVRMRGSKILGKMPVDKLAQLLKDEHPAQSTSYENFYKKAFDPASFFKDSPEGQEESKGSKPSRAG